MILADTSIWVDHLHVGNERLQGILAAGQVLMHNFIIGELALGNLRQRKVILDSLQDLPKAAMASDDEVLAFIEHHALGGVGIGYIDAHLLAAARLNSTYLWTRDKRLHEVAARLGLSG